LRSARVVTKVARGAREQEEVEVAPRSCEKGKKEKDEEEERGLCVSVFFQFGTALFWLCRRRGGEG